MRTMPGNNLVLLEYKAVVNSLKLKWASRNEVSLHFGGRLGFVGTHRWAYFIECCIYITHVFQVLSAERGCNFYPLLFKYLALAPNIFMICVKIYCIGKFFELFCFYSQRFSLLVQRILYN